MYRGKGFIWFIFGLLEYLGFIMRWFDLLDSREGGR